VAALQSITLLIPVNQLTIPKLHTRLSAVRIATLKHASNPLLSVEARFPLLIVLSRGAGYQ
jgi:hypothetical protein